MWGRGVGAGWGGGGWRRVHFKVFTKKYYLLITVVILVVVVFLLLSLF